MITPMDIHNKQFTKATVRGYSEEEVNDFLNQIVADYERIYREHREMEEKLDQMKAKLANYEKISETMTATLQLAKDTAENVKKNARRNADILIANAKADSEKQIKDAQDYREGEQVSSRLDPHPHSQHDADRRQHEILRRQDQKRPRTRPRSDR